MTDKEMIYEEDEINLMDMLLVLRRRKWIIVGIVFFSMLLAFLFITVLQQKEIRTEMVVALDFEGIDKGLYPDGSIFNSKDIVAPSVLNKVDVDINLSGSIFVEEVIPEYIREKIKKDSVFVYYPSRFKIVMIEREGELFDSYKDRADVLKAIAKMYKTTFEKKFIEEAIISFQFSDDFIQTHEYDDIVYIYNMRIDLIKEFLEKRMTDVGAFRSKENGKSFFEILAEISVLKDIDIKDILSKINMFNLVKDKQSLIAKLKYNIKNTEYSRLKNEKLAKISFELLKTVRSSKELKQDGKTIGSEQSNTQFVVDTSVLDKLKENDYVFYLIKSSLDSETQAIEDGLAIAKLNDRLEGFSNDVVIYKIDDTQMTGLLKSIQNKILKITQNANNLNYEYLELKFAKAIGIKNSPKYMINYKYKPVKILSLAFVAALFLSIFLAFFVDYIIRYKKNN